MDSHRFVNVVLSFLLFPVVLYVLSQPQLSCATTGEGNCGNSELGEESFRLSLNDGLLCLDAQGADLRKILEKISEKARIEIEIGPNVGGTISTSFRDIPVAEALKKITGNRAMVFLNETGQARARISKVVIVTSSQDRGEAQAKSKTEDRDPIKPPTHDFVKHTAQAVKTKSQDPRPTPLTIINEKTGIRSEVVPNELIVKFKQGLPQEDIQALIAKTGATVKTYIEALNYYVLSLPPDLSVNDALRWYRQQGVVDRVEPNYLIPLKTVPNDPDFSRQWALHNTGQTGGTDDADIDAAESWDIEQGNGEVVIAIIDTGVDYTHEDLAANIWQNSGEIPGNGIDDDGNGYIDDTVGWDFVDGSGGAEGEDFVTPDNDPMDRHGHGTHVAGIAGAVANNDIGIAGVAWNCKIMPVRAGYKTSAGGGVLESDDAAQAIIYAAENGARVINLSWGDYQKSNLIEDAMNYATNKGALVCAAAGNENSNSLIYPAASENTAVLAIGATDSHDLKASFSNYGDWVDVSAPGVAIYSTFLNNAYRQMSGTSMAAPHVAGVAALLFSYFPDISPIEAKTKMMRSVDVLADLSGKNSVSGRINAYSTLTADYTTPHIFSINPNAAHEGDTVTIFGDSFGDEQGDGVVKFYPNKDAEIISWSKSTVVCRVPEGAQTGELAVTTSEGTSNGIEIAILIRFYDETLIENEFLGAGTAQGWQADDQSWQYQLPFSFPFFGSEYESVYVCSNGFLDFTNNASSYLNSTNTFKSRIMIAPLWDDLITNGSSQQDEDIYIDTPTPESISFRWLAERYETGDPVNVEVILYKDGQIQFNYGPGNINLSPTVGISGGDGTNYHAATCDGISSLDQVQTVLFEPLEHSYSFTISLDLGWNLISLPLKPENNQVGQVMGDVNGGIESVWGYKDGEWYVYDPLNPGFSDLEVMKIGYGCWVKTTQQGLNIQVQGQMIPLSFNLTEGWNLAGFNSLQSMPVEEALAGIGGEVECVWGYKNGVWYVYDPQNSGFSDLDVMEPGMGYWLKYE